MRPVCGAVYLVGAGPGAPDLITVRGLSALRSADVVVFDRLIDRRILRQAPAHAELVDVGKRRGSRRLPQSEINSLLVEQARRGRKVVRLKGGDPFVFGRGFEELSACRSAGVDCVLIPGVSSAIAGPSAAGIPVTLRGVARSFAALTAETANDGTKPFDAASLAGVDTLVFLMGRAGLARIVRQLVKSGRDAETPVACVERATTQNQRVLVGSLADIAEIADRENLSAPMVMIVGEVAGYATVSANRPFGIAVESNGALAGKRILVTRPRSTARELASRLAEDGATPICFPMIRIVYPRQNDPLDAAIRCLSDYHWLVFSSVHGVKGFWRRLAALGLDSRQLGSCKVAAIGTSTARELRRRGITPDLVPGDATASSLVDAFVADRRGLKERILFPCGDIARPTIPDSLRAAGATVDALVAYSTVDAPPLPDALSRIGGGVDAVVLCSPSAARRFASLGVCKDAFVVCIGPTTADAAREAGLDVHALSRGRENDGLIEALDSCFRVEVNA